MLGHLGVNVPDLVAARQYYDRILPMLGFEPFLAADDQIAYRPVGGRPGTYLFLYPASSSDRYSADGVGLQHLAFMVRTRTQVRLVRDVVVDLGSKVVHEPRDWPEYPPPYYAMFWRDPFGIMLEAVCHYDAD